jgi:hypothetical protein
MSNAMLASMEQYEPFLQSPADDFESFFYVLQWAAVFQVTPDGQFTSKQKRLQRFVTDPMGQRAIAQMEIASITSTSRLYSATLASSGTAFRAFGRALEDIRSEWASSLTDTLQYEKLVGQAGEELRALMLPFYHLYAYRVVKAYLQILCDYKGTLKSQSLSTC